MSDWKAAKKKSRLVLPENRQRAAFSCDRCKTKKIKCRRSDTDAVKFDNTTPCLSCKKLGLECLTNIPRRRRVYSSYENLGIHYQSLLALVQGLYPDIDINDINELIKLGEGLGIKMPSGLPEDEIDQYEMESKILKPFSPKMALTPSHQSQDGNNNTPASQSNQLINTPDTTKQEPRAAELPTKDTVVIDSRGDRHYVGSSGTSVLFSVLCDLLLKRSYRTNLSFDYELKLFQNRVDNHSKVTVAELITKEPNFPIVHFIPKSESDKYIDYFFEYYHPFYFIFDEQSFRQKYQQYWDVVNGGSINPTKGKEALSNSFVGCIYLIWLTCSKNAPGTTIPLDYTKIIEVLQIILSDVALASTINSIQFLYLFARHLHSTKNRDSAWNLIGLAVRQAASLGIHKKIMSKRTEHATLTGQVFWSIYKTELTLCSTFGRPSNINEDEIDIDYPNLEISTYLSPEFKNYYLINLKLSRFLNKILKERRTSNAQQPISLINIERTLLMKSQLNQLYHDLQITPIDQIQNIYEYKLNLVFNYYMVTLTLPFMVYISATNYKVMTDETLLNIMKTGINASVQCSKLLFSAVGQKFNQGTVAMDCIYAYPATLVAAFFYIYLSNTSNDMLELEIHGEIIDKKKLIETISNVLYFMENSKLDSTTTRIYEVLKGIKNDLKLVEIQDNLKFDVLNFDGSDEVFDSLLTNDDIYTNGFDLGTGFGF